MLCALDRSSLRPRGDLRIAVSRLNRDHGAGRNRREVLRIRRNDRKGVSLGGVGETTRAVSPDVSRVGAVDAWKLARTRKFNKTKVTIPYSF